MKQESLLQSEQQNSTMVTNLSHKNLIHSLKAYMLKTQSNIIRPYTRTH